jgi:hypothetical protein
VLDSDKVSAERLFTGQSVFCEVTSCDDDKLDGRVPCLERVLTRAHQTSENGLKCTRSQLANHSPGDPSLSPPLYRRTA